MLKTRNIFIDTETFVANNFFQNKNLSRLAEFGEMDTVNLCLTEITIKEIQSNIREELQNAQEEINRFKKNIANKGRILKNVEEYSKYISLPKLDINVDYDKINKELDKFIETGKITIIPFETADLKDIINRYFNREKPFGLGKKKYEFPDAIVLSAIEKWCVENSCQIYVISQDKDLKDYTSKNIIPIPNLRTILNKINTQFDNDRLEWINKIFLDSEKVIKEKQLLPKFLKHLNKVVPLRLQDTVISPVVNYIFKPGLNAGERLARTTRLHAGDHRCGIHNDLWHLDARVEATRQTALPASHRPGLCCRHCWRSGCCYTR